MLKYNTTIMLTPNGYWLKPIPKYNPLNLPPNTVRVRTNNGQAPYKYGYTTYETATKVAGTRNVYDVYKSGTSFLGLIKQSTNVVEVLGANTEGITDMDGMFNACSSLTSVPLFDTSSVTNMNAMFLSCGALTNVPLFDTSRVTDMSHMFDVCKALTSVPLFNTSNVTNMDSMFAGCEALISSPLFDTSKVTNMHNMFVQCISLTTVPLLDTSKVTNMDNTFRACYNVESGALALYQQASSQANPPRYHDFCFSECGRDTVTGAAELAQIPGGWK